MDPPSILIICSSRREMAFWIILDSFMWRSVSLGTGGLFLIPRIRIRTNQSPQHRHNLYKQLCVNCRCTKGLEFTGQRPCLFLCMESCGRGILQNLWELSDRVNLKFSPLAIQRGFLWACCVCLCMRGLIFDPTIPLTHYSWELLWGCNVAPFRAAQSELMLLRSKQPFWVKKPWFISDVGGKKYSQILAKYHAGARPKVNCVYQRQRTEGPSTG